jgi:hypothetical protein
MRETPGDAGREAVPHTIDGVTEVTFLLPGKDLAALEKMASQRQVTTAALLRGLIASFLERETRPERHPT